jgi:hypothetical protein
MESWAVEVGGAADALDEAILVRLDLGGASPFFGVALISELEPTASHK